MNTKTIGNAGEQTALQEYAKQGYLLLEQNWHSRYGEIDFILQKGELLVFVEVKTRNANSIASPAEWVDAKKQRRIVNTAKAYLVSRGLSEPLMRFDVAEVMLQNNAKPLVNIIKNAF